MAHFAEIDADNKVLRVLVVADYLENRGEEFLANDLGFGGRWLKTSYNTRGGKHIKGGVPYRKNYAGIGYVYDVGRDAFIPPKPDGNYVLDEDGCFWVKPKP